MNSEERGVNSEERRAFGCDWGRYPGGGVLFFPFTYYYSRRGSFWQGWGNFFEKMSRVGTKNRAVQKHSAGEKLIETVTAPGCNGGRPGPSSLPYRRPSRRGGATGTRRRELRQYYALFRKRLLATVESTSQVSRTFDLLGRVSLTRNSHKAKARAAGEKKKLRLVRELRPGAAWWSR